MKKVIVPALMVLTLWSCKKDDKTPTRAEMINGTWKSTEVGTDDNANGTWDASERHAMNPDSTLVFTFNSDGNGTIGLKFNGFPVSAPLVWNLENSDNDIRVSVDYAGYKRVLVQNIVSLTSSDAVMRDQSTGQAIYTAYKKQ